jgi:hypothetical protein
MGTVRHGEFTTMLGCRTRVVPVTREDDGDAILQLWVEHGPGDDQQVTVVLSSADRVALRELLGES